MKLDLTPGDSTPGDSSLATQDAALMRAAESSGAGVWAVRTP